MTDLQIAPPPDRSPVTTVLIAALILAVIAAAVFFLVPRETAKLTVSNVQIFAPKTEFKVAHKAGGMNVLGQTSTTEDDLYVVATVRLQNRFRFPVSIDGANATLVAGDGTSPDGNVVLRSDITRLQSIFPNLAPMTPHPIGYGDEVTPGASTEGQIILQFPGLDAKTWQSKKSASISLEMHNQPPQTVPLP